MGNSSNSALVPLNTQINSTDNVDAVSWITFILLALTPLLREQFNIFNTTIGMKSLIAFPQIFFSLYILNCYLHAEICFNRRWMFLLLGCFSWTLLATLLSDHLAAALVRQAEWIIHGLFAYSVFMLVSDRSEWEERIIKLLCAGLVLYFLLLLMFWHSLPSPQTYRWVTGVPGFSNIRHLGYYAMVVVPLSLYVMVPAKSCSSFCYRSVKWLGLACMTMAWFLLAWSGGRAPLLGLSTAVVLLLIFRCKGLTVSFVIAIMFSAVAGALLSLFYVIPGQGVGRFFSRTFESVSLSDYSSSRTDFWIQAFYRVLDNPLFGLGPDGYLFDAERPNLTSVHPHSSILQIMLEWGAPGAFLFAGISISGMLFLLLNHRQATQHNSADLQARESTRYFALLWAIISVLALSIVDGSLYHAHPMMILAAIIGIAVAKAIGVKPLRRRSHILLSGVLIGAASVMVLHTISLYQALQPAVRPHMLFEVTTYFPSALADRRTKTPLENYVRSGAIESPCAVQRILQTASRKSRPGEATFFSDLEQELVIECK